jgi:hypothetical protein
MEKDELKQRASLVDERTVALFKRYPLVAAVVLGTGIVIGLGIGWLVF